MDVWNSLLPNSEPDTQPHLWSLELVTVVQQSRFEKVISDWKIVQAATSADDLIATEVSHLRNDFETMMWKKFGITIHPGDIVVHEKQDLSDYSIRILATWEPQTHTVEFRTGASDGEGWLTQFAQVPDLGLPFHVPITMHHKVIPDFQNLFGPVTVIPYRLAGWNEKERCWVFMPVGLLF